MSVAHDFGTEFTEFSEFAGAPAESVPFWPADYEPEPVPFWPTDYRPTPGREGNGLAEVLPLRRPRDATWAAPMRLTRRGVAVLAAATAVLAAALVWIAWLSAPAASPSGTAGDAVTVRSGDTLWSIATRVAPDRDPRAEIATLQRLNHLTGVELSAGQVLRIK